MAQSPTCGCPPLDLTDNSFYQVYWVCPTNWTQPSTSHQNLLAQSQPSLTVFRREILHDFANDLLLFYVDQVCQGEYGLQE